MILKKYGKLYMMRKLTLSLTQRCKNFENRSMLTCDRAPSTSIAPLMRKSLNVSSLAAADCLAPQDSPDLGGSDSDEFERKRTRKQSTAMRKTKTENTTSSSRQDGAPSMKRPGLTRTATQQVLRRRSTMVRNSAQPPIDRQHRVQVRGSLATKSVAPASESKAGPTPKAAAASKAAPSGARMGPVRILQHLSIANLFIIEAICFYGKYSPFV